MKEAGVRIVGFDCAEDDHSAVLLSEEGEFESHTKMVNQRDEIEGGLSQLLLAIPEEHELVVVVESKRSHGRLVTDVATGLGIRVWQVNTVALNHFRDLEGQPRKDDEWDAYLAARMLFNRSRGCREITETTNEEKGLSRLTRSHARLKDDRLQQVLRLRAALLELAPEMLHRSWSGPKAGSKALAYLLQRWPGFGGMEKAQLRSIEKILHRCRYGSRAGEVAKLLRDMARRISIEGEERSAITLELGFLLEQVKVCDVALKKLSTEISNRVEEHPIGVKLLEMPGIGAIIGGVLLSELFPVARTTTEAKSATYSGVTPLSRKTGKTPDNPRLARGNNKHVLNALYQSGVSAIKCSAVDKAYYQKKLRDYSGHPKPHVAAFLALARQRHKVIFKLMTTEARYDKETLIARHLERMEEARKAGA